MGGPGAGLDTIVSSGGRSPDTRLATAALKSAMAASEGAMVSGIDCCGPDGGCEGMKDIEVSSVSAGDGDVVDDDAVTAAVRFDAVAGGWVGGGGARAGGGGAGGGGGVGVGG